MISSIFRMCASVIIAFFWLVQPALGQDEAAPEPAKVYVGAYVNDIHEVNLKSNSYPGDIYIWFRWADPDISPVDTFEFMNLHDPEAHVEDVGYDEPEVMDVDGSFYNYIRHQGAFAAKMPLAKYPFDKQVLKFIIEDAEYGSEVVKFVADTEKVTINNELTLPGYKIGEPRLVVKAKPYPTTFGDLNNPETGSYSRVIVEVPISRPWQFGVLKLILPVLIILTCSGLSLLIDPTHTEGRIGLVITALLTLVAMQITTAGTLPEVSYLMLLDMVYIISYAYILFILAQVVRGSWQDSEEEIAMAVKSDKRSLTIVTSLFFIGLAVLLIWGLAS
ncbi:hypothetical protein [Fretibacter rubidus]|uniref:hypothetical protein n=1 Tax=Fretibacter rubidus TaxID=570162 RepID=UPI00352BAFDA